MRRLLAAIIISVLILVTTVLPVYAQQGTGDTRDPVFEQQVYDRLGAVNPDAVPLFKAATEAYDRGDLDAARVGFEQVLDLAPDFPDVLRRLSYVLAAQGDLTGAESLARKALEIEDSPASKLVLACILLDVDTTVSNWEALRLARQATEAEPDDNDYQVAYAVAAWSVNEVDELRKATDGLLRTAPDAPWSHFFKGLVAAYDGKWITADDEIRLSAQLGLPADFVQDVLSQGISSQARLQRIIRALPYGLAGWLAVLGILFLIGWVLSRVTLVAVDRQQGLTGAEICPPERLVRRLYKLVIALTAGYFYLSIPILVLITIAGVGLIIYGFFSIGHIPIKLAIIVLLIGVYTLYAIVRSLFARRKQVDPGKAIQRADAFYLWQILEETAKRLGTRPVDRVFVTAGTEIGVYERGNGWSRLRGRGERCLILGLGALPGMNQGQFQAILAHEYGHFNHADTAGGDLANSVSFHIHTLALSLTQTGTAAWFNPVWLFINGYYRIFLRVTQGASRLQEILADRYAAVNYGVQNLKTGLEHIIRQDLAFSSQVKGEIEAARREGRALHNLYALRPAGEPVDVEIAFRKAMSAHTSAYDSHPAPADRLAYLERIPNSGYDQPDLRPAWSLFATSTALQEEMTQQVVENLKAHNEYWDITRGATDPS